MQVHVAVAHKIEQWTQESCELRVASCMVIDVAAVYLPNCPSTDHLGLVDAERCDEDGSVASRPRLKRDAESMLSQKDGSLGQWPLAFGRFLAYCPRYKPFILPKTQP